MIQIREVHIKSEGSFIIVIPSCLYLNAGDIVRFIADDTYTYDIVIPNKDKFFVSSTGVTIEEQVMQSHSVDTPAVSSSKSSGTTKYYSVTRADGDTACAPPKIILLSSQV